ncbi:MAG: N-acetylmuramoyl-L-alanine amidase [Eubacterium sp.]|nr:N-acetylmuramoyl-L-alanine amidase [Eubacterium sp.]
MAINITQHTSTVNTTAKAGRSIKYIVLHYTAGTSSKAGAAKNIAAYFSGGSASGSADYIVDDETIVQYNPDILNRYCWAVGGVLYSSPATSVGGSHYGKCTNANSISIEICSSKSNTSTLSASDTDWYFTDAAVEKAVELTKYLMEKHGIGIDNVIMHHNVTGKVCPNPWCVNEDRLSLWKNFKARLEESEADEEVVDTTSITINGTVYTVNRILKDGKNYICLSDLAGKGFDVGYNSATKTPSLENTVKEIDVCVDGEAKKLNAVNIKGNNFAKLRDTTEALGKMEIDYQNGTVIINTK